MATIEFSAYQVHEVHTYFSQVTGKEEKSCVISFGIGKPPPFPRKRIEAKKLDEIRQAFEAYVDEAAKSGLQLQLSARVAEGRSPPGFNGARLTKHVNV
jgi:hypothetical protein